MDMIIDTSRPVTQWHQPFSPSAIVHSILGKGGHIQRLPPGKSPRYVAMAASSTADYDVLILPMQYNRLLPDKIGRNGGYIEIKNTRSFQSKADMLEIYNTWANPMQGLAVALKTIDPDGHYVGLCWFEGASKGKPRRGVLMAAPLVEGQEQYFLFNGSLSKECFEKAGQPRPEIAVSDYGEVCVCRVPSRSHKEAKTTTSKKEGTQYFHDVRVSGLPLVSNENHWANVVAETDNPDAVNKLSRVNKKLQMYWQDDGVAALLALEVHKKAAGDPLRVRLAPLTGKPLAHLDNRLRYNTIVETGIDKLYPFRPLTETERSYLLMAYIQAAKEMGKRDLYEYLFRDDTAGMEEDLIRVA